jgi:hypothetical protein
MSRQRDDATSHGYSSSHSCSAGKGLAWSVEPVATKDSSISMEKRTAPGRAGTRLKQQRPKGISLRRNSETSHLMLSGESALISRDR